MMRGLLRALKPPPFWLGAGRPGPFDPEWPAPRMGQWGEAWARHWYARRRGAALLESNWTDGRNEVDLIAREGEVLVFVEVKLRDPADPEPLSAARDPRRVRHLRAAAGSYLDRLPPPRPAARFDVLLVTRDAAKPAEPQIDCLVDVLSADGLL